MANTNPEARRPRAATKRPQQDSVERATNGHDQSSLAGDLLYGAGEIAAFLGWPVRRTRHRLAQGHIPATKTGLLYVGSKSRLTRHFQGAAKS